MAKQLGRWKCSTSLVGPRDGALLPSIADPVRTRTHDAAPPRRDQAPPRRGRDQEDPEPGELLCTIRQDGRTGEWSGEDCDGLPLSVNSTTNGLEIRHVGDPDRIGDANAGAPGELVPGRAFEQRMSAALAPTRNADQQNPAGIRGLQRLMNSHYARKRD
jgi:hypothetical protein